MPLPELAVEEKSETVPPPQLKQSQVFRNASFLLAAIYLSKVICGARAFINARWLGPEMYGFLGSLSFLFSFAYHLHLGSLDTMTKEVPRLIRLGQKSGAENVAHVTFSFYSVMMLFSCIAIWIYALTLPAETPSYVRWGWLAGSIALSLEVFYDFYEVLTRAEQRFDDISMGLLGFNIISLFLTVWLVRGYGFYGQLFVAILTPLLGVLFLIHRRRVPLKFVWSPEIFSLIRIGFPILLMALVFKAVWWVDRVLVLHYTHAAGFGYYLVGMMVTQLCFLFPQGLASVMEPRIHYDYAASNRIQDLHNHLHFPLQTLAYLMPLALTLLDLLLPLIIKSMLPQYLPGIASMRILIWGSLLMGFAVCTKAFMVAIEKQFQVVWIYAAALLINLVSASILAKHGWGLAGIATGTLISYFFCSAALLHFSYRQLGERHQDSIAKIAGLFFPGILAITIIEIIPTFFENQLSSGAILIARGFAILVYAAFVLFKIKTHIGFDQIAFWIKKSSSPAEVEGAS